MLMSRKVNDSQINILYNSFPQRLTLDIQNETKYTFLLLLINFFCSLIAVHILLYFFIFIEK